MASIFPFPSMASLIFLKCQDLFSLRDSLRPMGYISHLLAVCDFQGCVPVFLDDDTVDQYYNGYCNNVLWPLFHYIGLPQADRLAATRSLDSQYQAYQHANKLFAQIVYSQYQVSSSLFCHYLLPWLLYLVQISLDMDVMPTWNS
jgi:hypothetical protein